MVVGEILELVGVPGSIGLVVTTVILVKHGKDVLDFFRRLTIWLRIGAVVLVLAALAMAGFIPGVDLTVHLHTLLDALAGAAEFVWSLVRGYI